MKKTFFCALLLYSCLPQAFAGDTKFTTRIAGVEHSLSLRPGQPGKEGVPSYDYVYEQRAGRCHFKLAGHAVGLAEEIDGKMALIQYNGQDSKGRETPPVVAFDSDDLTLSLPARGGLRQAGIRAPLEPAQRARACAKVDDEGLTVMFRK
jgi:hypothetical protein